jgi:hypothetical protein
MKKAILLTGFVLVFILPFIIVSAQSNHDELIVMLFEDYKKNGDNTFTISSKVIANQIQFDEETLVVEILETLEKEEIFFAVTAISHNNADCFSCAPQISIASFRKNKKNLELISYNHITKSGQFGAASPVAILYSEQRNMPFLIINPGFTNQGITTENTQVYYFDETSKTPVEAILLENTYEDNEGYCEESENNCYQFSSEIKLVEDQLIVHKKGNIYSFEKRQVVSIEETSIYLFDGTTFKTINH